MEFDSYARESSGPLLRFALVLTNDRWLAQDLVQEILLRALSKWDRIGSLPQPHPYVRRMVVNEFVSWHRKWARIVPTPDDRLDSSLPDPGAAIDLRNELVSELTKLPRTQRAAIVMRYFEDMTDADIAAAMGCRQTTVRGYLHRGLKALRVEMTATADVLGTSSLERAQQS